MTAYLGTTAPVDAGDVRIGDRLVHDRDGRGFLVVTDLRRDGDEVALSFDNGKNYTHPADQRLWRVEEER